MTVPVADEAAILEEGGSGLCPPNLRTRRRSEPAELGGERLEVSLRAESRWALAGLLSPGAGPERQQFQTRSPLSPTPYTLTGVTPGLMQEAQRHPF